MQNFSSLAFKLRDEFAVTDVRQTHTLKDNMLKTFNPH